MTIVRWLVRHRQYKLSIMIGIIGVQGRFTPAPERFVLLVFGERIKKYVDYDSNNDYNRQTDYNVTIIIAIFEYSM